MSSDPRETSGTEGGLPDSASAASFEFIVNHDGGDSHKMRCLEVSVRRSVSVTSRFDGVPVNSQKLVMAAACTTANQIVLENKLPGSPAVEWDVNGAGSRDIEGFSTRASWLPGDRGVTPNKVINLFGHVGLEFILGRAATGEDTS